MPRLMFKYRLYPSKRQEMIIKHQLELCRKTHNTLLEHCRSTYKETGKLPTQYDLNNLLLKIKNDSPKLCQVHSQVLQNLSKRINDAYNNFIQRRKQGLKAGLPRFKKFRRLKSITYPQSGFKIEENRLCLSKIGKIKIRLHRNLRGNIKTLTVKRMPSGKWYVCFLCEVEQEQIEKPIKDVGIDLGLYTFATLSDDSTIDNPRFYRCDEKRLANLQKKLSRKIKGSDNWHKARLKVARLYERVENRRVDYLHKASKMISVKYETVYVEDLNISSMVKSPTLAKSISDASWSRFISMVSYKVESTGGKLVKVNPRNSSQICSQCGEYVTKSLSERTHACPRCGLVIDRDLNASRNILRIGREPSKSKPVEEMTTTPPQMAEQVDPVKQENLLLERRLVHVVHASVDIECIPD